MVLTQSLAGIRRLAPALALVACLLVLAGCSSSPALIKLRAKRLVLTLAQLPYPGFTVEKAATSGGYSDHRAASGDARVLRQLESEGRIGGYQEDFVRLASPQQAVGPTVVESTAVTYRTINGAASGLRLVESQTLGAGAQAVSAGRLGNSVEAFSITREADRTSYQAFLVEWRQANVVNGIEIEGSAATMDLNYALVIARVQQEAEVNQS